MNFLKNKTILITGGTGLVGSAIKDGIKIGKNYNLTNLLLKYEDKHHLLMVHSKRI